MAKDIKIFMIMILAVFLIGSVSAFEFDNVKNYDEETKTITVKNSFFGINWLSYGEVGSIKLINYTRYCLPNNCYSYYKLNHKVEDYSLKGSTYYNRGQTELLIDKKTKYEIYDPSASYEDPIYEEICSGEKENKTTCEMKNVGNETRYGVWNTYDVLTKLEKGNYLLREKIDVNSGETVDVVPNFYGLELKEWAEYTGLSLIDGNFGTQTFFGIQQDSNRYELASTFNMTNSTSLVRILQARLQKAGSPVGDLTAYIWTTDGTTPLQGTVATGSSLDASTISTSMTVYNFTFSDYDANFSTTYAIGFNASYVQSTVNYIRWEVQLSGGTPKRSAWLWRPAGGWYQQDASYDYWFGVWGRDLISSLTITLNSPVDAFNSSSQTINFNGTVTGTGILNVNLSIDGVLNETNNSGIEGDYLFAKTISDGDHNWTYGSCDSNGCDTATTRTFTIDTTPPIVNDAQNLTDLVVFSLPVNSTWNYTVNDQHIDSCYYNTSENAALSFVTCNVSAINTTWASGGNKTIQYFANDTGGLETSKLGYIYVITYNQTDDPDPVGEGVNVTFDFNISLTSIPTTTATLRLNDTYYDPDTTTATANYYYFQKTITIPVGYGNATGYPQLWLWNYTIDGVITNASTYDTNVTVYQLAIDDCSTYGEVILNLSLKDEEDNTLVNGSAGSTIEIDLRLTSLDNPTIFVDYNNTWTDVNESSVCIPLISEYQIDFTIGYQATDKVWEFFYLDGGILNSTKVFDAYTTSTIDLMDLITADSTSFLFNFFDTDGLPVESSVVHVFRKYIGEGLFREVERGKADENGDTVIHLVEEDVIYYFVITDNGNTVYTSSTYTALCQTTPCTIVLNAAGESAEFSTDYDLVPDGNFSINSSLSTRQVSLVYNMDTSTELNFSVYKYESDGSYSSVATENVTGTSGIITLSVPLSAGNVSFFATVYIEDEFIVSEWVDFSNRATDYFGTTLSLFLAGLIILTLSLIAVSEGAGVIPFVIIGVLVSGALGLISTSLNTGLSVLIYLIIAGGMIMWKLTGGRK